jgi:hypothetical protein
MYACLYEIGRGFFEGVRAADYLRLNSYDPPPPPPRTSRIESHDREPQLMRVGQNDYRLPRSLR